MSGTRRRIFAAAAAAVALVVSCGGGDDKGPPSFGGGEGGQVATGGNAPVDAGPDAASGGATSDASIAGGSGGPLGDAAASRDATSDAAGSVDATPFDGTVRDGCAPVPEDCNGVDDDCDGVIDDGNPLGGASCTTGLGGVCTRGTRTCVAGALICKPTLLAVDEICNGLDDDCSGEIDDGNPEGGEVCTTGLPGVCAAGTLLCSGGALVCTPDVASTPEICNDRDDNCNGLADEGNPEGGGACATGALGACNAGTLACQNASLVCVQSTQPKAETCNGVDDNCDGVTDEGNPGGGAGCDSGLLGRCSSGLVTCQSGALTCIAAAAAPETCNGLDENCDGAVDEGDPGGGAACTTGLLGPCGAGTITCDSGSLRCVGTASATVETCNGVDDDCDGNIDDGNPGAGPCVTGQPGICATGALQCQSGSLNCVQTQTAGAELCNGLDDDCDGAIDDGNPGGGGTCPTGLPGVCNPGTLSCQNGTPSCIQNVMASPEACNGLDDDCNGATDDGNPGVGASCSTGLLGVCAAGSFACQGGQITCAQNVAASADICNALDDDCNGAADDGLNGCGGSCPIQNPPGTACDFVGPGDLDGCNDDAFVCTGISGTACIDVDNDADNDGYSLGSVACGGDCDDAFAAIAAGAPEICDFVDNDCDGTVDENCGCEAFVWDGGASTTDWEDPINWAPDGVPGAAANHCATIPAGVTVTLSGPLPYAVRTLALNGLLTHPVGSAAGVTVTVLEDMSVGATGTIEVSGRGFGSFAGPGAGPNGSVCSCNNTLPGSGGGHGGLGGPGGSGIGGASYGNWLNPTDLGSGGGRRACSPSGNAGTGGGRVRLVVSGALTLDGTIRADGTTSATACSNGGGAGGSVWISAGSIATSGAPIISANGGNGTADGCSCGSTVGGSSGAGGRIAIDGFTGTLPGSLALEAHAGSSAGASVRGGAGTVFWHSADEPLGHLDVDNAGAPGAMTPLPGSISVTLAELDVGGGASALLDAAGGLAAIDALTLRPASVLTMSVPVMATSATVDGTLTHTAGDADGTTLTATSLIVGATGSIDVSGRGFGELAGPGAGVNGSGCTCSNGLSGSGGGYGGLGGPGQGGATPLGGLSYGSMLSPTDLGSGGGRRACSPSGTAGYGGGRVRLVVSGALTLDGPIRADGTTSATPCSNGGGSGGSVWITAGSIATSSAPIISANGGNGTVDSCNCGATIGAGSGAGGRIAIDGFTGALPGALALDAHAGSPGGGAARGAAGTVFWQSAGEPLGHLDIDNAGALGATTPLPDNTSVTLADLGVGGGGSALWDAVDAIATANAITVGPASILTTSTPISATIVTVDGTLTHTTGDADGVSLTATDLIVGATGSIDVSGRGFGGNAGPGAGLNGTACLCGNGVSGTGGGYGGLGGPSQGGVTPLGGVSYGSLLSPVDLGSGGGRRACSPSGTAGLGGGRVNLVVSGTLMLDGSVRADGTASATACSNGGGSGGSVWISAASIATSGTPVISANGGNGTVDSCNCGATIGGGSGAGGRIAIDGFTGTLPVSLSVEAHAGAPGGSGGRGAAGTVFWHGTGEPLGHLDVDNAGSPGAMTPLPDNTSVTLADLGVGGGASAVWDAVDAIATVNAINVRSLGVLTTSMPISATTVTVDGTLTHAATDVDGVTVSATNMAIGATGSVNASGRGLGELSGPGAGVNGTTCTCSNGLSGSGGGHGGPGGAGQGGLPAGGAVYGSSQGAPMDLGSGGGRRNCSGSGIAGLGGGLVHLFIDGTLAIDGSILANGTMSATSCSNGGGSGGSIWLAAANLTTSGAPVIAADGGSGTTDTCNCGSTIGAGGGGGGRVAIFADVSSLIAPATAIGGSPGGGAFAGSPGVIHQFPGAASLVALTAPPNGGSGIASSTLLQWGALAPADHFHVEVDDDPHHDASPSHPETGAAPIAGASETPGAPGGPLFSTSWATPALVSGTTYYWHVVAHDAGNNVVGGSRMNRFVTP